MKRGGILQRMRTAGLLLALFALTFKAMLPPGFMLQTGADRIAITLCGGEAMLFDPSTGRISHDSDQAPADDRSSPHCPFALASAPALVETATAEPRPTFAIVTASAPVRAAIGEEHATGPPLPARGPPTKA